MNFDDRLAETNRLLSMVKIRQSSKNRLSLRGRFPDKNGAPGVKTRYELSFGLPATVAGLTQMKAIALEVESLLIRDKWDWADWQKTGMDNPQTSGEWITAFERSHWERVPKEPAKLNSFHKDYRLKFSHLPHDRPLSIDLLRLTIIARSLPGTRSRQGYSFAYARLAEFAGLPTEEIRELGKGYAGGQSVTPRSLPSDEAIALAREKFSSDWQWVYEAIALYGLRPHEVFKAERDRLGEDPPVLIIPEETKTGYRIAFPLPIRQWRLSPDGNLPLIKIEGRNNNQLGMAISQKFRQLKPGFKPYDLRHSYARRGFELGLPPDFLAHSMGHSLEVHLRSYRAWWGDQPYLKVYREAMLRANL